MRKRRKKRRKKKKKRERKRKKKRRMKRERRGMVVVAMPCETAPAFSGFLLERKRGRRQERDPLERCLMEVCLFWNCRQAHEGDGSRIDCGHGCVVRFPDTLAVVVSLIIIAQERTPGLNSSRGAHEEFCDVPVSCYLVMVKLRSIACVL
jgi:hypothetical protein